MYLDEVMFWKMKWVVEVLRCNVDVILDVEEEEEEDDDFDVSIVIGCINNIKRERNNCCVEDIEED